MKLSDIEFDHEADCVKHRELGRGVTYEQDGVLFSSGFVALKIIKERAPKDKYDDMSAAELRAALRGEPAPVKKKIVRKKPIPKTPGSARQRADNKLAGFRAEDNPEYVKQALSENHAAVMAEENAQ